MSSARSKRVEALFQDALDRPEHERSAYLDGACDDPELRREVDLLLGSYEQARGHFLERPVASGFESSDEPLAIGPYRVVGRLGEGSAGVVFEAEQERPRRRIAIKLLKPGLYGREQLRRFHLECDVLGQLAHPGIARVFEAGDGVVRFSGGASATMPYMAMELIRGRRLLDHVAERQLDVEQRLRLFAEICDGVSHAHEQAIIHRDLKPGNVLVEESGQPKILDFGVARVVEESPQATRHTRTGDVIGTLQYMSPEQLFGQRVDVRSDVYSLGVILYELLVGEPPYEATSTSTTLTEMMRRMERGDTPRPSRRTRSFRGDLDAITMTALTAEPGERYASAAELARDVRRYLAGEPVHARAGRGWSALRLFVRRNRRVVAVATSFVALVLASSVVAWTLYSKAREAEQLAERERAEATARLWESYLSDAASSRAAGRRGQRLESLRKLRAAAEIRPSIEVRDGVIASLALDDLELLATGPVDTEISARGLRHTDRAAFTSTSGLTRILSLPGFEELQRLQGPPHTAFVQVFSPDGRFLATKHHPRAYDQEDVRFWVWDLERGTTRLRLDAGEVLHGRVCFGVSDAHGPWVGVVQMDERVHLYLLDTGERWQALGPLEGAHEITYDAIGDRLAASSFSGDVAIWHVGTGEEMIRAELPTNMSTIQWVPGGDLMVGTPTGELFRWNPETLERGTSFVGHQGWITHVFPSTDGRVAATRSWDATARVWDLDTGKEIITPLHTEDAEGFGDLLLTRAGDESRVYRYVASTECVRVWTDVPYVGPCFVDVHREGRLAAVSSQNAGIRIWDLARNDLVATIPGAGLRFAAFVEEQEERLLGFDGERLASWPLAITGGDIEIGEPDVLWHVEGHNDGSAAVSYDESRAMITSPSEVVVFDLAQGKRLTTLEGYPGVASPGLDPMGRFAMTGMWRQHEARIYDLGTGEVVARYSGYSTMGAFCRDGRHLMVCAGSTLEAYATGNWDTPLYRLEDNGRQRTAGRPLFAADGRTVLLAGSYDIRLYDHETGERLATLTPPERMLVSGCAYTPDGNELIVAMQPGVLHRWDLGKIRSELAAVGVDW